MKTNTKFEILTPSGWSQFDGIRKKTVNETILIITNKGKIRCTPEHMFRVPSGEFVEARYFTVGMDIESKAGVETILTTEIINERVEVFDAIDVAKNNEYFTNGFVSHNCRFMGASNTLLDGPTVERLFQSTEAIQPVAIKYDGRFRIYEEPKEDRVYMAIVDPSEGVEQDYSAISVIDITEYPMKQIAVFRCNRTSELLLAPIADSIGRYYNDAYILVESNKGSVVLYSLNFEFEYDNLLNYRPNRQTNSNAKNQIGVSRKLGIETTKLVKRVGCSRVKEMIESRKLDITDHQTAMEFLSFIEKGNSYEADDGKTDDIVMTLVLFAFYANTPDFNEYQGKLFSREYVRDRLREIHDELLPAEMFLDDGENPYDEFSDTYEGIENMSGTERSGFLS